MDIDAMIKANKPTVPRGKVSRRKGKPLSKRLLSPRQDVVRLKSINKPPMLENYESISPKQPKKKQKRKKGNVNTKLQNNKVVVSNNVESKIVRGIGGKRNVKTNKLAKASINIKHMEDSYKKLQFKQKDYNKSCLARKDPHRLRIPVSPRVLSFHKPLSSSKAKELHKNINHGSHAINSTENYRNVVKKTQRDMRKRVKNVYSTVTSKQIDALGNKTNASDILQRYIQKKTAAPPNINKRIGMREKDFIFLS